VQVRPDLLLTATILSAQTLARRQTSPRLSDAPRCLAKLELARLWRGTSTPDCNHSLAEIEAKTDRDLVRGRA
jgi:hypothetical protein